MMLRCMKQNKMGKLNVVTYHTHKGVGEHAFIVSLSFKSFMTVEK